MSRLTHRVSRLSSLVSASSRASASASASAFAFAFPLYPPPSPPYLLRLRLSHSGPDSSTPSHIPILRATRGRMSGPNRPSESGPSSPESDPASAEDYVHIDDPNPNVESLSESFVGVDDSRADEPENDAAQTQSGIEAAEGSDQNSGTLPEELWRSVAVLSCESSAAAGVCDVYIVGTAHVSQESCREVQAVISHLKPEVVFLELCSQRVALLSPQNLTVPTFRDMIEMWKKRQNPFGILYSWFLAKVASKLEVFPGAEFRVAYEEAVKYGGKVILGDRPVQITIRRTWDKMPLWHKTKLLYSFLFQAVFLPSPDDLNKMLKEMDDVDMMTLVIQEMSKEFPTLMETLLHERDQYMSSSLLKVAREHSSVVAVVGKGHMHGIKKYWKQPVVVKDLLIIPSQRPTSVVKMLASVGVAAAGVAIVAGIYFGCKK